MRRRTLIWQLYPSYLLITLISLLAVTTYASRTMRSLYLGQVTDDLEARAVLIRPEISQLLSEGATERMNPLMARLGERSGTRITVILPNGRVVADSERDPATMDNHANRPEVRSVLDGEVGASSRYSRTLKQNMMYVAVPLFTEEGSIRAVVRTARPTIDVDETLSSIYARIGIAGLIIALLAAWISWVNARRIAHPLEEMRLRAKSIAAGDLSGRLPLSGTEEVASLADALNQMAAQLDDRIRTILRQRREQKAVFASISDGVLAVDAEGLLISINRTAARLFGVNRKKVRGQTIQEVIANADLRYFISVALETTDDVEDEIVLEDAGGDRFLQAHGRPLRDEVGNSMGAVVVLNDVTRLRRLEKTRRDFVANVSHELRTPVTSIKGFVETLKDGALEDPEDAHRFVDIIARQADRLDAIIEDLLALARIEREHEGEEIDRYPTRVLGVVESAFFSVQGKADDRQVTLRSEGDPDLEAWINPPLLEQAIVNLVDNAVKYSDQQTTVLVRVEGEGEELAVRVIDEGHGISAEHLPRLFERFYRVDKGRSRAEGGTGLGLAIVKHIAIAHGGSVEVDSVPGEGTTFTLRLPREPRPTSQLSLLRQE